LLATCLLGAGVAVVGWLLLLMLKGTVVLVAYALGIAMIAVPLLLARRLLTRQPSNERRERAVTEATAGQYNDSIPPLAAHGRASRFVKLPPVQSSGQTERFGAARFKRCRALAGRRSTRWLLVEGGERLTSPHIRRSVM